MRLPWSRRPRDLSCQEVVELVTAYLDGALPASRHDLVKAHLDACPDCSRYLDQIRSTIAALGELPLQGLDDEAYGVLSQAFRDLPRGDA